MIRVAIKGFFAQTTRHIRLAVVILDDTAQCMSIVYLVTAFKDHIVYTSIAMLAIVATAYTRIKNGAAQAVIGGSTNQHIGCFLKAILVGIRTDLGLYAALGGKFVWNCTGYEVDDASNVLRTVADGTTTSYHIYGVHVAYRNRSQGELWLTVGGERYRDAVHEYGRTGRQTWVEPTDTEVECHIVTASAIVFRRINTGNTIQDFSCATGTETFELFAAYYISCAGVIENILLFAFAKPITDHRCFQLDSSRGCC